MILSARAFLSLSALTLSVVIGGMWLYTSLMRMAFLESSYPIWVAKQAMISSCAMGSVLVMGDSRSEAAIVPNRLGLPASNVSLGATDPVETYFFAARTMRCPDPPQRVVYAHSMSSFLGPNQFLWKNAARYGFVSFRNLRDIAHVAADHHDPMLADTNTNDNLRGVVRDLVYSTGFPTIFMASLIEARGAGRYGYNTALLERTSTTRGQVIYADPGGNNVIGMDAAIKAFTPSSVEADYFDRTLNLFTTRSVRVLVITIPVSRSTVAATDATGRAIFVGFLNRHARPGVTVANASSSLTGWPDDLFVDGSHLNQRGAAVFSDRLAACLHLWPDAPDPAPCDFGWR